MDKQTEILSATQIEQKVRRMAWQIQEHCYPEKEIILAGIIDRGLELAQRIKTELESLSDMQITLCTVEVNKENPLQSPATVSVEVKNFEDKTIVLVDDVLNSGKTLIYGARYFLQAPVKKLLTAVLVDRNHNRYPIKADLVGMSLSTTLQEHVHVDLDANRVFLT